MRLNRLDLARYGKFTGKVLDFGIPEEGRPDMHLIFGPNEAGKSTLFSGWLDLLFGIESRSPYNFLHPYNLMRVGADLSWAGNRQTVYRVKRQANTLLTADDRPLPDTLLAAALGGIDRATCQMMFSLDDDSIERGGEAILKSEGELGALLFSASSGLPDTTAVLDDVRLKADAFHRASARKTGLAELKRALDALKAERAALDVSAQTYQRQRAARDLAEERHAAAIERRAALRHAFERQTAQLESLPLADRLKRLIEARDAIADGPVPPTSFRERLPALRSALEVTVAKLQGLEAEAARQHEALAALEPDAAILALSAAIDALEQSELEARHRTAARDMPARALERAEVEQKIAACLRRLGQPPQTDPASLLLPVAITTRIEDLSRSHSGLQERLAAAETEVGLAAEADAAAEAALSEMEDNASDAEAEPALLRDAIRAASGSTCVLQRGQAKRQIAELTVKLERQMQQLQPFEGMADALVGLDVPLAGEVAEWKASLATLSDDRRRVDERLADDKAACAAAGARLKGLAGPEGFDEQGSLRLREARNAAWAAHRQRLDAGSADLFEQALTADDRARDHHLARASDLAEMRGLALSLAERNARMAVDRDRLQQLETAIAALTATIAASARACGLPEETTPARLESWLARRLEALQLRDNLDVARTELAEAEAEEDRLRDLLMQAMASDAAAIEDASGDGDTGLAALLSYARERLQSVEARGTALQAARNERARLADVLSRRSDMAAAARKGIDGWAQDWRAALSGSWLDGQGSLPDPVTMAPVLTALQELDRSIEARAGLDHRIAAMRNDQASFASRVETLLFDLGEELSGRDPLAAFEAIRSRRATAREQQATRLRLEEEARLREANRVSLEQERQRLELAKTEILEGLGVETLDEAEIRLQAALQRIEIAARATEVEADLCARLKVADGPAATALLDAVDLEALALARDRTEAELAEADLQVSTLFAECREAETALAAIGSSDAAARLEEQRRTLVLDIAEQARDWLRQRAGVLAVEQGLRLYRERHRSAMMQRASDAFRTISGGEYSGLSAEIDRGQELLVANAAAGGSKLARDLSKGTRFQLYLALRMAGYVEVASRREPVPFIADDIMETFDDQRAGQAFRLLSDMALTGQVIYLTHHEHLLDIATTVCPGVTIHRL